MAIVTVVIVTINMKALNAIHTLVVRNTKIKHNKKSKLDFIHYFLFESDTFVYNEIVQLS